MTVKKAILIIAPGGCGNHLWDTIMVNVGSVKHGDNEMGDVIEKWPPTRPLIHWFRSMPNLRYPMETIKEMILSLRGEQYEVHAIVPVRDWYCAIKSQEKRHHVPFDSALYHLKAGYPYILRVYSEMGVPFIFGDYEAATHYPEYVLWVLRQIGINGPVYPEIYDGNQKWYETKETSQ
jgi:hypothetical protein